MGKNKNFQLNSLGHGLRKLMVGQGGDHGYILILNVVGCQKTPLDRTIHFLFFQSHGASPFGRKIPFLLFRSHGASPLDRTIPFLFFR